MINVHTILVRKLEGKNHLEDLDADGSIVLKLILEECGGRVWADFVRFRMGPLASSCENDNELSDSIIGEFSLVVTVSFSRTQTV
jgi:hypothetical protein